jgi:hypothetical protein
MCPQLRKISVRDYRASYLPTLLLTILDTLRFVDARAIVCRIPPKCYLQ